MNPVRVHHGEKRKKKGEHEDGGQDGLKYVGGRWIHTSDTAVIVYFAPAFEVNLLLVCYSGRLNTVALGRSASCRASLPQGFSMSSFCLPRYLLT